MPITPKEARAKRKIDDIDTKAAHYEKIDAYLAEPPNGQNEWWYSTTGMSAGLVGYVMNAYRAAGWAVRVVDDQRDGSAIVFSEAIARG